MNSIDELTSRQPDRAAPGDGSSVTTASLDSHPWAPVMLQTQIPAGRPERAPSSVARNLSRVAARARLEQELRSIAVDLLGTNESDEFPEVCTDWVAATTESVVPGVCQAALDGLVQAIDSVLVDVPPAVARRLDEARVRHDVGYS